METNNNIGNSIEKNIFIESGNAAVSAPNVTYPFHMKSLVGIDSVLCELGLPDLQNIPIPDRLTLLEKEYLDFNLDSIGYLSVLRWFLLDECTN